MTRATERASVLRALVSSRLEELRGMSDDLLRGLPKVEETRHGDDVVVTTFSEPGEGGRWMIVVQATRDRLLGISTVIEAGGFVVDADGSRYPLAAEDLWDFE